jgi:Fic family protein
MQFDSTRPFEPPRLPPNIDLDDKDILKALIGPHAAIAGLNGLATNHPNPALIISPAVLRESVASSNIENVNTTLADVIQGELFPEPERTLPDKEVLRYRDALLDAHEQVDRNEAPIATRLIQQIQRTLLPGSDGAYRKQQNRIANDITHEVLYTPPPPPSVPPLMGDLGNFINDPESKLDPLLRAIIGHYQFEAIHPFPDGNGRVGRILMVLQLRRYGLLFHPILYISAHINKNKTEYYRRLRAVSSAGDWKNYILFMLDVFENQARAAQTSLLKMNILFEQTKRQIMKDKPKIYSGDLVDAIFKQPVITPVRLKQALSLHQITASKYLSELEKIGILKSKRHGRYHLFINHRLLTLLKQ